MAVDLVLAPEAEQDLLAAYDWYESCRSGLGEEFLGCVDACIRRICRAPKFCAKVHGDYRRALVRRFPYAVFYEYTDERLTVYCVCHTSQNPNKWRSRFG